MENSSIQSGSMGILARISVGSSQDLVSARVHLRIGSSFFQRRQNLFGRVLPTRLSFGEPPRPVSALSKRWHPLVRRHNLSSAFSGRLLQMHAEFDAAT